MEGSLITSGLIVAAGCGLFLRLVAKEKHRREKYLLLRLEEKIKEQEDREKLNSLANGTTEGDGEEPVEILQAVESERDAA